MIDYEKTVGLNNNFILRRQDKPRFLTVCLWPGILIYETEVFLMLKMTRVNRIFHYLFIYLNIFIGA